MTSPLVRRTARRACVAIAGAERFLRLRQAPDGGFRDYWMKPGQSEDWITACVGVALAGSPWSASSRPVLARATGFLQKACRPGGWGYNRDSVCDADSSAWALRFLALEHRSAAKSRASCLGAYLDETGRAHTFGRLADAGAWGSAHADVTAVVGLALVATGADFGLAQRVREATLADQGGAGHWASFWWTTDAYASARALEFLALSGGIPEQTAARSRRWLATRAEPAHAFEAAQLVAARSALHEECVDAVDALLEMQTDRGEWPPSPALLTPNRDDPTDRGAAYADEQGILGSAMALMALKSWLSRLSCNSRCG